MADEQRLKRPSESASEMTQADENQPKRRHEGSKPTRPPSGQQQRPASAIMASLMGDQNQSNSLGLRSESATSGGGRQHKLKQRFTVIRKLGKGTYGKVQLAINKETGQEVAIKTIKKTKIENEQDLERVRREIQIMSSIEHPHIIHIYEVFENKDKIVLIMQYAPGGELYEYVSQSKVLDEQEARRLFRQIATAIYYCHQNKICHRDLKLENILLDEKNNAKLADFGLSNVFDKSRQLKTFCGSPLYASPEIVQGSPYEGPEVDCWSLGVLLYTLVYGAMPFDGSNFKRLVKQISEACYYEPKQRSQASPLIGRLLCADPMQRATIIDICSDPWVNGLVAPQSPNSRLSPTPGAGQHHQQNHPSLLKVAQDMANLTPVRLDILLALTPQPAPRSTTEGQASEGRTNPPPDPQAKLADDNQRQIIQPARGEQQEPQEVDDKKREQVQQRQEEEKAAIINQLGSDLMEVDETRSTSPVASYVVRDLSPSPSKEQEPEAPMDTDEPQPQASDKKPATIEEEIEQLEAIGQRPIGDELKDYKEDDQGQQNENVGTETLEQFSGDPIQIAETVSPKEAEKQSTEQDDTPSQELTERDSEAKPDKIEPGTKIQETAETEEMVTEPNVVPAEGEVHVVPTGSERPIAQETKPETSEEQIAEASETKKEEETQDKGEEKPKKVRKKIIVKKRRKVVKKDTENGGQDQPPKEGGDDQSNRPESESSDAAKPKKKSLTPKSPGPGKVRIPETFAATSGDDQPPAEQMAKETVARRPSALITDVSQKLLMQQQQQSQGSSSAIEQDQTQLASVRVSDKKSEFERRASLAAAAGAQSTPISSPKGGGSTQQLGPEEDSAIATSHEEPERYSEAKREPVMLNEHQPQAEQVERLKPSSYDQLRVIAKLNGLNQEGSEPLTPTNLGPSSRPDIDMARRLSECAERLTSGRREGERSDSIETIKPESDEGEKLDVSPGNTRSVRSSLQIDLSGAQAAVAEANATSSTSVGPVAFQQQQRQQQNTGGSLSIGPAPITRSYKKVTFTKDGTCITETGRIYSTQADDGTMRRVERKSKVTHYTSDDPSAHPTAAREETTTHEEIVYESRGGGRGDGFWPRSNASNISRPLERLIMPSDEFYDHVGDDDEEEGQRVDDDEFGMLDEGLHQQQSQFRPPRHSMRRTDSASSCSSGSTDVFDDIFDTWTGAISMFNQRRHLSELRNSLMNRAQVSGSPLPFGRQHSSLSRRNLGNRNQSRPASSSGNPAPGFAGPGSATISRQRCESVEPASIFDQPPRPLHHRRHRSRGDPAGRPPSADGGRSSGSGYESDAPRDRAPGFGPLGSARARFGSSNLFPRAPDSAGAQFHPPADPFLEDDQMDLFARAAEPMSLIEQMELEHERLRRRFAQQRRQMWKGSTPALNEIPEFRPEPSRHEQPQRAPQGSASLRSGSGSQWSTHTTNQQQQSPKQTSKRTSVVYQIGSSGSLSQLRQSTPLDAAPVRRNTANLAEHLPQQQVAGAAQVVRRSTSRTSIITSQLANIQLDENNNNNNNNCGPHQKSASFIELKRATSSSSSTAQRPGQSAQSDTCRAQRLNQAQPGAQSATASSSSAFWADERATPTTCGSTNAANTTTSSSVATSQQRAATVNNSQQHHTHQDAEANSRIQNWLLQSAGNLSVSSGSKSSASDATLPSSGRSDAAGTYLASSAGQMVHHPLRRDESVRTTTSSLMINPAGGQQQRMTNSQSRTIVSHQLPPTAQGRSPTGPRGREKSPMPPTGRVVSQARPISTLIVRSSSKQSLSEVQEPGRVECREVHTGELIETLVGDGDSHQELAKARQRTVTSSSAVISQRAFAFPIDGQAGGEVGQAQQSQHVVQTQQETVTSSRQQVFSQATRLMAPMSAGVAGTGPAWFQQQQQDGAVTSTRGLFGDEFNDLDSLGGSGADLESSCSSSLLDQLRARGYKSMISQRMVSPNQQVAAMVSPQTSSATTGATTTNVVTTSSTQMTVSSASEAAQMIKQQQSPNEQRPEATTSASIPVEAASEPTSNGTTPSQAPVPGQSDPQQPVQGQQEAGSAPETERGTCDESQHAPEEDLDEDVREAKANIKEYLERMRETEKFLKSMHEEEEKFQRQRQELFLFNNLLLSTKLNGIKTAPLSSQLDFGLHSHQLTGNDSSYLSSPPIALNVRGTGPHSAPLTNHLGDGLLSNGFMTSKPLISDHVIASAASTTQRPQVSCFSSDLYSPMAGSFKPTNSSVGPSYTRASDPLEPVQPIGMHAYQPTSRNWRRSKSQLGEQFYSSPQRNRPLSANIDATGGNAYFPSRQRRSSSQVRYSHHHNNPSVLATVGRAYQAHEDEHDSGSPSAASQMMSEYRSSFGPNLVARSSRSPKRALSPGQSPIRVPTTSTAINHHQPDAGGCGASSLRPRGDSDEEDLGLSSYRVASYVPRVIPEVGVSGGRGLSAGRAGSYAWRKPKSTTNEDSEEDSAGDRSPLKSGRTTRRMSVQPYSSYSSRSGENKHEQSDEETTESPSRRKSWTSSADSSQRLGQQLAAVGHTNSRLSELEQRLQANKRRREELLLGINETSSGPSRSPARRSDPTSVRRVSESSRPSASRAATSGRVSSDEDELDQSFGFERPSRPAARSGGGAAGETTSSGTSTAAATAKEHSPSTSLGGGVGATRARPSRLESMEARIKRRSYCIKLTSPDRTRNKWRSSGQQEGRADAAQERRGSTGTGTAATTSATAGEEE